MPSSIAEASYDLALRAIEHQERRVNELRRGVGTLVAAASIAASVLGAQATAASRVPALAALAISAYVCCVLCTLYVLLPHRLAFEFRGSVLFDAAVATAASDADGLGSATDWIEESHQRNRDELGMLGRWYRAAVIAAGVEIVLWTMALGATLI